MKWIQMSQKKLHIYKEEIEDIFVKILKNKGLTFLILPHDILYVFKYVKRMYN
jgi:ABC-type phosphate/phosphonate transport system ATPase subunit